MFCSDRRYVLEILALIERNRTIPRGAGSVTPSELSVSTQPDASAGGNDGATDNNALPGVSLTVVGIVPWGQGYTPSELSVSTQCTQPDASGGGNASGGGGDTTDSPGVSSTVV